MLEFETGGVMRGDDGTWDTPIELRGGTFGDTDAVSECLHIGGNITIGTANTIVINGGTVALTASVIADGIDMDLNGGTFHTGIGTGNSESLNNLTLTADSGIGLGKDNAHTLTFAGTPTSWGSNKLTVYDWQGVAGASGTKDQLFIPDLTTNRVG